MIRTFSASSHQLLNSNLPSLVLSQIQTRLFTTSVCVHCIYLIHKFHNLSWITEINELFHDILIYWDAPVYMCRFYVTVHGFPVPSSPCLVCVRVRMCEQVSVGVCDWGWFAPAESHHRWAISVPVTLSPLSDPCSVCGRRLRSVLVPRFLSPAASWTPITGPLAAHCFPALPASTLRRAPLLPTESSASAYGKLRLCPTESSASAYGKLRLCPTESSASALRKAPFLPTESSASALRKAPFLPTESSASVYEELHFSFSLCITSCNKLSFPQLNPPVFIVTEGSDHLHGFSGDSWFARTDIRQQRSYGSPGGEYVEHRTSCAGVSGAGVRAHNPGTVTKITRCATHTA